MNTTIINIKTEEKVKTEAQKTAHELGLSLSAVLNAMLRQFIRTKTMYISLREEETPTSYFMELLRQSKRDIKAKRLSPKFSDVEDAIAWLHKKTS